RRSGDDIAGAHGMRLLAEAILAGAGDYEEQLVHHVMAMERKCFLAGRHHMHSAAEPVQPEERTDPPPLDRELLAVAAVHERHIVEIDDHLIGHPTLPSRLIEISFCASTANSIGSCCSTSLTKPLTTSATASSSDRPRCMQ